MKQAIRNRNGLADGAIAPMREPGVVTPTATARRSRSQRLVDYAECGTVGYGAAFHALVLGRWWITVMLGTLALVIATGLYSKFVARRWYRASAILEPTPYSSADEFATVFGSQGADLSWLFGEPGKVETIAHEYITVLSSFTFQVALAHRHHLTPAVFDVPVKPQAAPVTQHKRDWTIYRLLAGRFNAIYSFRAGNLTLSFVDTDPERAVRVLEYFISDLHDQLRVEEINHRSAAASTLEAEIRATTDPVLSQSLYTLLAKEIERQKLAQVVADLDFRLLSPPVVPDLPYWPNTRNNCLLAGFFTAALLGSLLALYDFLAVARIRKKRARDLAAQPAGDFEVPEEAPLSLQ